MCYVVENGYKLESTGRVIPFTGFDFGDLSTEEFAELRDTKVSMISQLQLKTTVFSIEAKIDKLTSSLEKAIAKSLAVQKQIEMDHSKCPVDEQAIISIVSEWHDKVIMTDLRDPSTDLGRRVQERIIDEFKSFFKQSIFTGGNIAKAVTAILVLLGILAGYIFTLTEFFIK